MKPRPTRKGVTPRSIVDAFDPTGVRDGINAEAAKRRLHKAIGFLNGSIQGLGEVDWGMVVSVADADEIEGVQYQLARAVSAIRTIRTEIKEAQANASPRE